MDPHNRGAAIPPQQLYVPRPRSVTIAMPLFVASAVLWLPIAVSFPVAPPSGDFVLLVAYVVFAIRSSAGRRRARVVATVLGGLAFLVFVPFTWLGFLVQEIQDGPAYAVMDMAAIAAFAAAIVLIYLPASNAYFRACWAVRTVRRGPPGSGDPNGPGGLGGPGPYGGPGSR